MIEATCGACGTVARMAEADVPVGAKFVTCSSCKSRVPLPQAKPAASVKPSGKPPGVIPPAIPKTPPPPTAGVKPAPGAATKPTIDLADLPAPKRASPLAGTEPSKPAPRSPLAGAELPAPKGTKPPGPSALDLDELLAPASSAAPTVGLADLPAPKPRPSPLGDAGPSRPAPLVDLPAPKTKPGLADSAAPRNRAAPLADLPAPKRAEAADLLAPKQLVDLPAPTRAGLDDLPAPKQGGGPDQPAPKTGGLDLASNSVGLSLDDDLDLPMPKDSADLPAPKAGASDLPAPKGFFDDLPQPASTKADLPAPKGFFDDLPQPASTAKPDVPAPKGFFDDLPQPASTAKPDVPAPKGFFDDLPQPTKAAPPGKPGGKQPAADLFDGIGGPVNAAPAAGFGTGGTGDLDLSPSLPGDAPLELDTAGPELDLGLPLGQDASFSDLDLSPPTAGKKSSAPQPTEPGSPIKIKTPSKGAPPSAPIPIVVKKDNAADVKLDLADDLKGGAAAATAGTAATKAKQPQRSSEDAAAVAANKRKRTRIVLASVLGVALLGSGGFYVYQRHAKEQAKQDEITSQLGVARKQLADGHPQHWQRAAGAAQKVLELEPNHGAALGLAAEAAIAGALDNGANFDARIKHGRKLTQDGLGAGKSGPELERAQALMTIAANQPDRAIAMLQKQLARAPKDGWLQLYMGWAQLAKGDADAAIAALDQAIAAATATKVPALYSQGKAKLLKADLEGARTAFAAVLEIAKEHIGAQVGLAATLPPQQSAQREADLLAILARPDLNNGDPRAVVQAWDLVGDVARNGGRLDIARERYRKALALVANDLPALVGLAAVELRDGKLQIAADLVQKATAADAGNAELQLLAAELDVVQGKLPDGESKIDKLAERQPPLPPLLRARLHVVKGRSLEAQGKDEEAIAEYTAGAKLAGELDLTPTMAAVTKLTAIASKEADPAKANALRKRADELLSALAERAKEDAELSMTLGVAYLQAGDAAKAEDSLRRAVTLREKDPESKLQLAKALVALNRTGDAIAQLTEALAIDPARRDISLELARTHQNAGNHAEAMAAYDKLLADPAVPVIVRENAGRYFARRGAFDKAAAQAEPILATEPNSAAGHYLKGEGLMLANNFNDARVALTRATDLDEHEAQYLDALGRAFEGSLAASGDTKYVESARHAYERATKADPNMFHPQLGLGRMLVAGGKWDEAIKVLAVASSLDKTNADVMYHMGVAFYGVRGQSSGHKKTAADWLQLALKNPAALPVESRADAAVRLGQLYVDLNKAGDAARAMDDATRLGEEIEKQSGKTPEWLTELYYDLGDMYYKLGNRAGQKRAWQRYVDRRPKPGVRLNTANYQLGTELKRF